MIQWDKVALSALTTVAAFTFASQPLAVKAAVFNPQEIISDAAMRDAGAMSPDGVRAFLAAKGSLDGCFDVDAVDGLLKGATQLVADAARRYDISPKYILALLQKESGIVESSTPPTTQQLDWAAGYALCDGCSRTAPAAQKYRGLARQIDAGASWMDWYLKNGEVTTNLPQAGQARQLGDGVTITPANRTTAGLYAYTPHLHGNRLLWSILNRWFGQDGLPDFPDGSLIRNEKNGAVALIQGGKFRPILTPSVLATRFRNSNIIDLNEYDFAAVQQENPGQPVKFADLSLVRDENGTVFLLVGASRRRIASTAAFAQIGFNPEEVEDVASADLAEYAEGEAITVASTSPVGQLAQDSTSGGVYYVESGVKHPLLDRAILTANFAGQKLTPRTKAELARWPIGDPIKFADGTLLKSPGDATVYVISNGQKRPITSETAFLTFGYRWADVLTASRRALDLHELGEPLAVPSSD